MSRHKNISPDLLWKYRKGTLEDCVKWYESDRLQYKYNTRMVLRAAIGVKVIYGEVTQHETPTHNAPDTKHADTTLLEFYDTLPLDQCIQLYKMQHDNVDRKTRYAIRAMIAAKYIYGNAYVSIKNQQ